MALFRDNNDEIKEEYSDILTKKDKLFYTIIKDVNKVKPVKDSEGRPTTQQILVSLYPFIDKTDSFVDGVREWNNRVENVKEVGFTINAETIEALENNPDELILYPIVEEQFIKAWRTPEPEPEPEEPVEE